jgi:hypothetical protein
LETHTVELAHFGYSASVSGKVSMFYIRLFIFTMCTWSITKHYKSDPQIEAETIRKCAIVPILVPLIS